MYYSNHTREIVLTHMLQVEVYSELHDNNNNNNNSNKQRAKCSENLSFLNYNMNTDLCDGSQKRTLCYNGQKCHRIPETLVKLYGGKVHSLDLSYNELATLRGLEGFPLLQELVLDNNQLTDSLILPFLPHLHTLSLNKNKINDLELLMIKISHNLPGITYLSLLGNKACPNQLSGEDNDDEDYQRYRYYVLYRLPNLKFLDSSKVKPGELAEAKRRGQFMKIVRPKTIFPERGSPPIYNFTPLPRNIRNPDDHRGAYGRLRYKYSGKHSEGNRFISNNDL